MSADLLKRAAKVLREHAEKATPGPWDAETPDGGASGRAWVNTPAYQHSFSMHGFPVEANYVALIHPPVALALADWLEANAEWMATAYEIRGPGRRTGSALDNVDVAAIALAREILRETR